MPTKTFIVLPVALVIYLACSRNAPAPPPSKQVGHPQHQTAASLSTHARYRRLFETLSEALNQHQVKTAVEITASYSGAAPDCDLVGFQISAHDQRQMPAGETLDSLNRRVREILRDFGHSSCPVSQRVQMSFAPPQVELE